MRLPVLLDVRRQLDAADPHSRASRYLVSVRSPKSSCSTSGGRFERGGLTAPPASPIKVIDAFDTEIRKPRLRSRRRYQGIALGARTDPSRAKSSSSAAECAAKARAGSKFPIALASTVAPAAA